MLIETMGQVSYNDMYLNITYPYVETVNGLGIPTNGDPVCVISYTASTDLHALRTVIHSTQEMEQESITARCQLIGS